MRRHFGPEPVLDGVTFEVRPGERIGLVGPNGSGKTTLLRIVAGRDDADAGTCQRHASVHLGYLEQQPRFEPGRTLHDEARSALAALISLEEEALSVAAAIAETTDEAEHRRLAARYDHLQHELQRRDAYNLDYKIQRVLDGLRFTRAARNQPVDSLSGGEQNRLMLAKLLLAEPNLMLLDEPSNHLDIEATEWLEEFLVESSAAMIVVSHDRYFLDKVTNRTLELFRGTVDGYAGNFSAYWQQKAERLLVERRTYEKQQIEIEKTKDFIRRNAYGQKHAQAEDRRKKLERIEPVPPPREIAAPPMGFPAAARSGDIALRADGLAKSYDRPLFADVSLQVIRGERWAVLGPNGCGKTTLLRCLLGLAPPDRGTAVLGTGVAVGYFDQQLAELDEDAPAYDSIRPPHKQFNDQQRRDLLARFGVTGDTALQTRGQSQRRRAVPRGAGPPGRGRRQLPGARRADQPSRPVGPRRAGERVAELRRHRALRQPRPLLRQPRGRSPADRRRRPRAADRGELRDVSAVPRAAGAERTRRRRPATANRPREGQEGGGQADRQTR